jgi:hypothetical protein
MFAAPVATPTANKTVLAVALAAASEPWSRFALGLLLDKLQSLSAAYQMRSSAILGGACQSRRSSLTSITLGLLTVIGDSFHWLIRRQDSASAERASLHGARRPAWEDLPLRQLQELANTMIAACHAPASVAVTAVTSYASKYPIIFWTTREV